MTDLEHLYQVIQTAALLVIVGSLSLWGLAAFIVGLALAQIIKELIKLD
jgi:hypothetical protein